jgi:MEMO1 family protein
VNQIVGCVLMPHPPILIPEIGKHHVAEVEATKQAMEVSCKGVKNWNPETLVLITPHGPVFRDSISITATECLQGNFANFGAPAIRISADSDVEIIKGIMERSAQHGIPVLEITEAATKKYGLSTELDHGAMVPLYYLAQAGVKAKVVHISIGWLDYEELFAFGQAVQEAVQRTKRRVAVICSGDLSHRLTPDAPAGYSKQAREFDERIVAALGNLDVKAIRDLDPQLIDEAGECGLRPIYILLGVLDGLSAEAKVLSYEGPFGVGYAVIQFQTRGKEIMERNHLDRATDENIYVDLARRSLEHYILTGRILEAPTHLPPELMKRAGVFVSLKENGQLRGCIGTFAPTKPNVAQEIISNAISAGTGDPRFFPVEADELNGLVYSVDVLSPPEPVKSLKELDPKKYGVIIRKGHRSGLLLPDLEGVDTVEEQVSIAKQKAGIHSDENVEVYKFLVTRYK